MCTCECKVADGGSNLLLGYKDIRATEAHLSAKTFSTNNPTPQIKKKKEKEKHKWCISACTQACVHA